MLRRAIAKEFRSHSLALSAEATDVLVTLLEQQFPGNAPHTATLQSNFLKQILSPSSKSIRMFQILSL
jgi:hypothetical protein